MVEICMVVAGRTVSQRALCSYNIREIALYSSKENNKEHCSEYKLLLLIGMEINIHIKYKNKNIYLYEILITQYAHRYKNPNENYVDLKNVCNIYFITISCRCYAVFVL